MMMSAQYKSQDAGYNRPTRFDPYLQQTSGHYRQVANRHGQPAMPVEPGRRILNTHQETILHRVHIDGRGDGSPLSGYHAAHVPTHRRRCVDTSPAEQLRPPGHVGILAVGEEIRVEEVAVNGDVVDHLAPVQ